MKFDLNSGALAPVSSEREFDSLDVTGEIPIELNGILLRNGPNPLSGEFSGHDLLDWWPEAAMLHAVEFIDGKAIRYSNRWLRTRRWANYHSNNSAKELLDTNPSVNVIRHAGELLALGEGGQPVCLTNKLETLGPSKRSAFNKGMSAHPKKDPKTEELITFKADWNQPWLSYGVIGPDGEELCSTDIEVPTPLMMHDIAVTETHSLFFDCGVTYDFSMMAQGYPMPLRWHEDRQCRIGVIPRFGGPVQWFEIEPCFIQHTSNAFGLDDRTIVVDVVRYPCYLRTNPDNNGYEDNPLGVLWRYTIDLESQTLHEAAMDDIGIEFPRINESRTGSANRYLFTVEQPSNEEVRGVLRYDLEADSTQRFDVKAGNQNGEPVFVQREGSTVEDDGFVLVYVYQSASDSSDLYILDATDISNEPIAVVHLPTRVPAGFHSAWMPSNN